MRTDVENKFKCKVMLKKAINEKEMNKKDFECIIKHIFKCNEYLVKQYNKIKKLIYEGMYVELNSLLKLEFFINDITLITWIARKLNQIIKYSEYNNELIDYLIGKRDSMNDSYNNRFQKQLSKLQRNQIFICDDGCFSNYFPVQKSESYYRWNEGEPDVLYPEFDEELTEIQGSYLYQLSSYPLSKEELENINEFDFVSIDEEELFANIRKCVIDVVKHRDLQYPASFEYNILDVMRLLQGYNVRVNCRANFDSIVKQAEYNLYDYIKQGIIQYKSDDTFIMIEQDENGRMDRIFTFSDIMSLIDMQEWIQYMQVHDIQNLEEMYVDKLYKVYRGDD